MALGVADMATLHELMASTRQERQARPGGWPRKMRDISMVVRPALRYDR